MAATARLRCNQDIEFLVAVLGPGQQLSHRLKPGRHGWLQLARGGASLNGMMLHAGDGAAISMEEVVEIKSLDHAEIGIYFALEYTEGSKSMFRIQNQRMEILLSLR
jgi:redox-sensitive bicupin YhaK (pirin superfamily)